MELDSFERAILVGVDRLTRDTYGETDGRFLLKELVSMGVSLPPGPARIECMRGLSRRGYLEGHFSFGDDLTAARGIRLTGIGREEARQANPFERVYGTTRAMLASDAFAAHYPDVFAPWSDAEALLNGDDAESQLTTIGHKGREAMQAFATAMVAEHRPPAVDPKPANVERRLGAVIALYRSPLGGARRGALEALGALWEATNKLVQRQEHAAQREGEPMTIVDARRIVVLTMFLMVEFVLTFEDCTPEPRDVFLESA